MSLSPPSGGFATFSLHLFPGLAPWAMLYGPSGAKTKCLSILPDALNSLAWASARLWPNERTAALAQKSAISIQPQHPKSAKSTFSKINTD